MITPVNLMIVRVEVGRGALMCLRRSGWSGAVIKGFVSPEGAVE